MMTLRTALYTEALCMALHTALCTEALRTEALRTEALRAEALCTEALRTEALRTETLRTEALHMEALRMQALHTTLYIITSIWRVNLACFFLPSAPRIPCVNAYAK